MAFQFLRVRRRKIKNDARFVHWYQSAGSTPLQRPGNLDPAVTHETATIYMHQVLGNTQKEELQIWIWKAMAGGTELGWHTVSLLEEERHPAAAHLVLSVNNKLQPTWVVPNTAR
ncbi:hypothetical protein NM688_g1672 [Phlebia brevispora]|uniref:Uncharacterized protein n=1 Tax=Phlebia brevispora TaxID=194682 RepID=A0ACC1TB14_9APHY|nr:hypothetical protein NM688_g1672 [Phlebia brevispora]